MSQIIKFFEDCKLESYQDSAGVWTIGWGSTKNVKAGMKITQEEADKRLEEDLKDAEDRVRKALPNIYFSKNELEALISLAYNLRSFEMLVSYLPDRGKFKKKMLLYCRDIKGNFLKGLKIRRIAERLLFEGREWSDIAKELQKKNVSVITEEERKLFYV